MNLNFYEKYFVMEISWGQGLNWLNWEFKDLVGINWEVGGQIGH